MWALTPREIAAATRAFAGEPARPPNRQVLDGLMQQFPDGLPR
ncbi:phage tail assembly chaperone [Mangrovicella endophytica]|nr:phage tail assembly chaperone [Mangrovicella endophytica]